MRSDSHRRLGRYLAGLYLSDISSIRTHAFLIGCIEPDRNPATYLKGSFRHQWLRGHNYRNAYRFMKRISRRLERKHRLNFFDYYTLGKLIHYTADAFTHAHNADFPDNLRIHREYETELQNYFLSFMEKEPLVDPIPADNIIAAIRSYHRLYEETRRCIHNDARFALTACCCVLTMLMGKPVV